MRSSRRLLFVLFGAALLTGAAALAQGPGGPPDGPGTGRGWHARGPASGDRGGPGRMLARLGLDEAQMEKVKAVHLRAEKARVRQQADLRIAEIELRELMAVDTPDRKKLHAQIDRMTQLHGDLRKLNVDCHLDVLALLTPEQRDRMTALRGQRPGWGQRGAGVGRGRGARGRPGWGPPSLDDDGDDD